MEMTMRVLIALLLLIDVLLLGIIGYQIRINRSVIQFMQATNAHIHILDQNKNP